MSPSVRSSNACSMRSPPSPAHRGVPRRRRLEHEWIEALTPAQLERALPAKAQAALHLHELTAQLKLSAFVLCSSIAGRLARATRRGMRPPMPTSTRSPSTAARVASPRPRSRGGRGPARGWRPTRVSGCAGRGCARYRPPPRWRRWTAPRPRPPCCLHGARGSRLGALRAALRRRPFASADRRSGRGAAGAQSPAEEEPAEQGLAGREPRGRFARELAEMGASAREAAVLELVRRTRLPCSDTPPPSGCRPAVLQGARLRLARRRAVVRAVGGGERAAAALHAHLRSPHPAGARRAPAGRADRRPPRCPHSRRGGEGR